MTTPLHDDAKGTYRPPGMGIADAIEEAARRRRAGATMTVDRAEFDRAASIKAWETRDRGAGGEDDAASWGKRVPSKRGRPAKEWLATPAEIRAAKRLAAKKARENPRPTKAQIAKNRRVLNNAKTKGRAGGELRGNSDTRRRRGEALFAEFGGKDKGYCPCGYCGVKVSPKGSGGHAAMQQDKILTAAEGGRYGGIQHFENLIPSCGGCNSARGDTPYHVRPDWEDDALAAAAEPELGVDWVVDDGDWVASPIGWNDPEMDTIDSPVQGQLARRRVMTPEFSYVQVLVGGEVVDENTVKPA